MAAGIVKGLVKKTQNLIVKLAGKTLLEYSLIKFVKIKQIKKTIVVKNKNIKNFLKKIKFKDFIEKYRWKNKTRSTFKALNYIKKNKLKCRNVLIHDSARPNFSINLIKKIIKSFKK